MVLEAVGPMATGLLQARSDDLKKHMAAAINAATNTRISSALHRDYEHMPSSEKMQSQGNRGRSSEYSLIRCATRSSGPGLHAATRFAGTADYIAKCKPEGTPHFPYISECHQ